MSSTRYTPDQKKLVRRLLILHGGDVNIVHHLTDIPKRTLYRWRDQWDDAYDLYMDALAQKVFDRANAAKPAQSPSTPIDTDDDELAQPQNQVAQLATLRDKLMEHVTSLTNNLMVMDGNINNRAYAISRLLDRILQLNTIINQNDPEREHVVRFEYYYDGEVHDAPPWKGASEANGYYYPESDIDGTSPYISPDLDLDIDPERTEGRTTHDPVADDPTNTP